MTAKHSSQGSEHGVEPEPAAAAELVAPERLQTLRTFAEMLIEKGETLGLIGPQELPRLWSRHLLNSLLLAPLLRASVADVGSGGGFPGLPLAIARPDVSFTLIEPMDRRCAWLQRVIDELNLDNATVLRGRAEEVADQVCVEQVTARAVAALSKLIPLCAPLLRHDGELLFLKGQSVDGEITKARKAIAKFELMNVRVEELGAEHGTEITRVFRADLG